MSNSLTQFDSAIGPGGPRPGAAPRRPRRAFTITELMLTMSILILLIGMAMPVFRVMTGSRSIEFAQNKIGAMISRARAQAVAKQRTTGLFFFQNPQQDGYMMAIVYATPTQSGDMPGCAYLDIDSTQGFDNLPFGIQARGVYNPTNFWGYNPNNGPGNGNNGMVADQTQNGTIYVMRVADGYLGYDNALYSLSTNNASVTTCLTRYGPVVMFDAAGHLAAVPYYGFRCWNINTSVATNMGTLLFGGTVPGNTDYAPGIRYYWAPSVSYTNASNNTINVLPPPASQMGLVIFDDGAFHELEFPLNDAMLDPTMTKVASSGGTPVNNSPYCDVAAEPGASNPGSLYNNNIVYEGSYAGQEGPLGRDLWIDATGAFLAINRYDGAIERTDK